MKDKLFLNGKLNLSIGRVLLTVIMLVIVIVGGTFAWLTYRSNQSALVLTIGDIHETQIKLTPYEINANMIPVTTYQNGVSSDITVTNQRSEDTTVTLFYKVNQGNTYNADLNYTIVKRSGEGENATETIVDEGEFNPSSVTSTGEIVFSDNITGGTANSYYRVYLWSDGTSGNTSALQGSTASLELNAQIGSAGIYISGKDTAAAVNNGNTWVCGTDKTGVINYGDTLGVNFQYSASDAPDGSSYTYQWFWNSSKTTTGGHEINGATGSTYKIGSGLVGTYLYVVVTVDEKTVYSAVTDEIVSAGCPTLSAPENFNLTYDATTQGYTASDITTTSNGTLSYTYYKGLTLTCSTDTSSLTDEYDGAVTDGGEPKNAGTYSANISITAEMEKGVTPVRSNYGTNYDFGTKSICTNFTIVKKAVTLIPTCGTKVYSGLPLTVSSGCSVTNSTSLLGGHTVSCTNIGSITNVGTSKNTIDDSKTKIMSGSTDVTSNYDIKTETCDLTITPKPVKVVWDTSTTLVYNGSGQAPIPRVEECSSPKEHSGYQTDYKTVNGETMNLVRTLSTDAGSHTSEATCISVTGGQKSCSNYMISANNTVDFDIEKAPNPTSVSANSNLVYNGTYQDLFKVSGLPSGSDLYYHMENVLDSSNYTSGTKYDGSNLHKGLHATSFRMYYYVTESTNYKSKTGYEVAIIAQADNPIEVKGKSLTYNGSLQNLVSSNIKSGSSFSGDYNVWYSLTTPLTDSSKLTDNIKNVIPQAKNAGTYTIYYAACTSMNFKCEYGGQVTSTIGKYTPEMTLSPTSDSVNFDGVKTFTSTVKSTVGNIAGTVSSSSNASGYVGTSVASGASITATSSGANSTINYTGIKGTTTSRTITVTFTPSDTNNVNSVSKNFTVTAVNKIDNPLSVSFVTSTLTYNGSAQTLVQTPATVYGDVYYSTTTALTSSNYSSAGSKTLPTGTNAGDYTVYYYSPGNDNYYATSGSKRISGTKNIARAAGSCTVKITGKNEYFQELTATITTSSNGSKSYAWYHDTNNDKSGGTSLNTTTQKYTIASGLLDKYIYVNASVAQGTNYTAATCSDVTDATANTTATVKKASISPTVTMSGYTYGGTKSTPSVSGNTGNGSVTYYYNTTNSNSGGTAWSNVTSSTSLNAGTYYMYAVIGETTNYKGATTPAVSFVISKATPTCSVAISGTNTFNQKLTATTTSNSSGTKTYSWYYDSDTDKSGGTKIGNSSSNYTIQSGLAGKYIYVSVTIAATTNYNSKTCSDITDATANTTATVAKAAGSCTVAISGKNTYNETLTATITTSSNGTKGYAWYSSSSSATSGGTSLNTTTQTYKVNNVGKYIYVNATVAEGTDYTASSCSDVTDATANTTATSAKATGTCSVKITGTNTYNQTLTATITTSSTGTKSYAWYHDTNTDKSGGTSLNTTTQTYKVGSGLAGKYIYVTGAVAADTYYTASTCSDITDATNNGTATVSKISISPTVTMSGYTYGGTKSSPSISGNTDNGTVTYYYNTTNSNSGGTAWSNVTSSTSLNAGTYYMYAVVGATTNYNGATTPTKSFVISKATGSCSVRIYGTNTFNEELESTISTSSNGTKTYKWYSNSSNSTSGGSQISGATSSSYKIGSGLAGKYIYVNASVAEGTNYTAATCSDITDNTNSTATVAKAVGSCTVKITGKNEYFQQLTATITTSSDGAESYSWYSNASNSTSGGTSLNTTTQKYTVASGLRGKYLYVNASVGAGTDYTEASCSDITDASNNTSATVALASISPTVSMSGYTYGGTKSTPSVSGNTGNGSVTYYYNTTNSNSGGTAWSNVTSSTSLNAGTYYMYAVIGETTNYKGATTPAVSFVISKATPTCSLTLSGNNIYNQQLTSTITNNSGGTKSYKWYHDTNNDKSGGTQISGATSSSYKIGSGLAGKYIYVVASVAATTNYNSTSCSAVTSSTIAKAPGSCTVAISGTNTYNQTLTATISTSSDGEKGYSWYSSSTSATTGGTSLNTTTPTYKVNNVGKYIYVNATVKAGTDYTEATCSDVTDATANTTATSAKATGSCSVKITGTNTYNQTLTATITTSSSGTKSYAWYHDTNTDKSGGTSLNTTTQTYKVGSGLAGKYIYVTGSVAADTYYTASTCTDITDATNNATATVAKASISPTVSMSGYIHGGTKSTPSVSGNSGNGTVTYYYNTTNSNSGGTAWSTITNSLLLRPGTYYMYAVVGATTNYNGATTPAVSFTVSRGSYDADDASYLMTSGYDVESSVYDTNYLRTTKKLNTIKKVVFNVGTYDITASDTIVDVSAANDGSVLLWYNESEFSSDGTVYIGSITEYLKFTDGYGMFGGLTSLQTIEFGTDTYDNSKTALDYIDTSEITSTQFMFSDCNSITSLNLSFLDTTNVSNMNHMFRNFNSSSQVDLTPLDSLSVGTINASYMFYGAQNGDFVFGGNLFTSGKISNMNAMFSHMTGAGTLDLSSFNTSNVTNMSNMFYYATQLTGINVSSFNTSNVTNMSSMFEHTEALTSLNLSNFNTAKVTTMANMFTGCYNLSSLNISSFSTAGITNASTGQRNMFSYMYRLSEITLGANFEFLDSTNSLLPEPSSEYITDATGVWYNVSTWKYFTPERLGTYSLGGSAACYGTCSYAGTYSAIPFKITYYNGTTSLGSKFYGAHPEIISNGVALEYLSDLGGSVSSIYSNVGWSFVGWSTKTNDSVINYTVSGLGDDMGGDINLSLFASENPGIRSLNLYAVYGRSIKFYSGDPTTEHSNKPTQYFNPYSTATTNYTIIRTDSITAISGKTAYRWKTSAGTLYSPDADVRVSPSVSSSLYAVYTGTTTSSATFYSGSNGSTENTVDLYYYSDINACKIGTAVSIAAYSGWTSNGWRIDTEAGTSSFTTASTSASIPCSDKYYAIYTRTAKGYYGLNGVANNTYKTATQYYNPKSGKYSTTLPTLTSSYTSIDKTVDLSFIGWRDDTTAGNKEYSAGAKVTSSNTSYYAIYSGSVTFYSGESEETEDDVTLYYNSANTFGSSTFPTAEAISGYTVSGWIPSGSTNVSSDLIATNGSLSTYDINTYYAVYKVNDVSFKSGPSSSQTTATVPQHYKSDDTYILSMPAISTATDVTIGSGSDKYTKVGWKTNTSANTSGGSSTGGSVVTSGTAYGTNYYALYSKSITFKSGKNQATTNTSTAYYNSGSGGSVTPPTAATITNYSIKGWRTDGTASSTTSLGTSSGNPTALTYYAVYSRSIAIKSGPGTSITSSSVSVYYNTQGNISGNTPSTASAFENYTLVGWNQTNDIDLSDMLGLNSTFAFDAASAYSAVYQIGNITFKSGVNGATEVTNMEYYSTIDGFIVNVPTATAIDGFSALGWRADNTASTASITSTGWYSPGGTALSTTYYAVYSKSVQFNDQHGVCGSATQYYNSSGKYKLTTLTSSSVSTPSGFTFLGWRDDTSVGAAETSGGEISTSSASSFYAAYGRDVTFHSGSGGNSSTSVKQYRNTSGNHAVTTPTTATAISGATFHGWIDDPTVEPTTSNTTVLGMPSSSSSNTFHAVYLRTLTFKSGINTGSTSSLTTDGTARQYFIGTSSKVGSVTTPTPASISNWTTSGYSSKSAENVTAASILNYGTSVYPSLTEESTLYAVYQQPFKIWFDFDQYCNADGACGESYYDWFYYSYYVSSGTKSHVNISYILPTVYVPNGYQFIGWTPAPSDPSGYLYEWGDVYTNSLSDNTPLTSTDFDIVIFAVWSPNSYVFRVSCSTGATCTNTELLELTYGTVYDVTNYAYCTNSGTTMYITQNTTHFINPATAQVGLTSGSLSAWDGSKKNFRYFKNLISSASDNTTGQARLVISCS